MAAGKPSTANRTAGIARKGFRIAGQTVVPASDHKQNEGTGSMTSFVVKYPARKTEPVMAKGIHAEMLGTIEQSAQDLIKFAQQERFGVYDGLGQGFWTVGDALLTAAKRILDQVKQLRAEQNDGRTPE